MVSKREVPLISLKGRKPIYTTEGEIFIRRSEGKKRGSGCIIEMFRTST